jgi:enoyl-CoA hydratase
MSEVEFKIDGHIAVMTINRPQARNALNAAVATGLGEAFAEINRNPEIRVGILTGAGGHFCSGMDLKAFIAGEKIDTSGIPYGGAANVVVTKPLIAAVEGFALAGGFELALVCDLIVASRASKFGLPEVKRGLVAAGGGLVRLPRQGPIRFALEMALTGDAYDAETCLQHGLINRLAPEGEALAVALELAGRIAQNAPLALAASKKIIRTSLDWLDSESFDRQKEITQPVFASADAREGAIAFAEKRPPKWTGA